MCAFVSFTTASCLISLFSIFRMMLSMFTLFAPIFCACVITRVRIILAFSKCTSMPFSAPLAGRLGC